MPEFPTETTRAVSQTSIRMPRSVSIYPEAAEAENGEHEEMPDSGISQLKDLELQIQRLAEEINALESGC